MLGVVMDMYVHTASWTLHIMYSAVYFVAVKAIDFFVAKLKF